MSLSKSKILLLQKYKKNVTNLRERAKALNLTDSEVDEIFNNCFKLLKTQNGSAHKSKISSALCLLAKIFLSIIVVLLILYVLLNVHQPTTSIVLRNVQGLIYPGLKVLRFLAVPVLKQFPSLTYLYDETCLVENPFFYVANMECWPCEEVHTIIDLTGFSNHSLYQSGIPYIAKTTQKHISWKDLHNIYSHSKEIFNKDANSIKSSNTSIKTVISLFNYTPLNETSGSFHVTWRINRMEPARLIRSLFPRPYIISDRSGQSLERFVIVDEPNAKSYSLPNPECSYAVLIQSSGMRTIILKPSRECSDNCKTVSVVLKPSFVLWYNWWYWRPISLPVENATDISVSYLSSYC